MGFVSDTEYRDFLDRHIKALADTTARNHVRKKFDNWRQLYCCHRLVERICELLTSKPSRPSMLYLSEAVDLEVMGYLAQRHQFEERSFRGFLVDEGLWNQIEPEWFAPFPVHRADQWRDTEDTVVYSLSDARPCRTDTDDRGNDYLERFIDLSRFSALDDIRQTLCDRRVVLYVDYRKVQTLAALSEQIRKQSDLATVLLANSSVAASKEEFDAVFKEPFYYLWPLVFERLASDIFHLNVGWGTQGLPFTPFLPDETIIDFYDLLTFVQDESLKKGHPEPLELTRASEKVLFSRFKYFVHRCSDDISDSLRAAHPGRDIVSVTEYLREPVYEPQASDADSSVRLAYGGLLVQEGADEDDPHYKNFLQMVKYYGGADLELYLYPSPYLYGFGPAKGARDLAQRMGLDNIHTCTPLEENDFVREISQYDFGLCLPTPEDIRPTSYGYILPSKFIAYLRAGLPIVVPEDQTFIADLVRDHEIGVVYGYDDRKHMPELLKSQDINRLKQNVVRFREQFRIERGAKKIETLYKAVLDDKRSSNAPADAADATRVQVSPTCSEIIVKLNQCGFIGPAEYQEYLLGEIGGHLTGDALQYVRNKFQEWYDAYNVYRCLSRLIELIADLGDDPYRLYLDGPACMSLLPHLLQGLNDVGLAPPAGFIVSETLKPQMGKLVSCPVFGTTDTVPQDHTIIGFSGTRFPGRAGRVVLNDYRERFIDVSRFRAVQGLGRGECGGDTVLYPMYREIHTVSAIARFVGRHDRQLRRISLSPGALIHPDFDHVLVEPFLYLWPIIFKMIDPGLVHLYVGWGIQALALSPFLPDRKRTVVDFYEVLSFLPDAYFEKTHSSAAEVRMGEKHFLDNYDHIVHLCSDEISGKLMEKYGCNGSIVSVTEYLEEPTYSTPSAEDDKIRLVYGGCMLATTNPDDLYYKAFARVAPYFTRDNLHLYIYNSPYVHGISENVGLQEVIKRLGLTNAHACASLPLDAFVGKISEYDYGVTLLRPKDMEAVEYNYFMATKLLTYLRAGLPVVIDADNHFMASLVNRYNIGVVLQDYDLENLSDILNNVDLPSLKRNVLKFRNEFSIEKGGAKVLGLYHEILGRADRRTVFPSVALSPKQTEQAETSVDFNALITSMAEADNRLYYRDQSPETLKDLVSLAQNHNPSVVVELGTLAGLSLRAWIAGAKRARIYALDLSFQTLRETMKSFPIDMSRVTLAERDILQTDFTAMWGPQDKVILFIDAHDMPNVPIMDHVLKTAVPALPDGSVVVVDDLWYNPERLTTENAKTFLENRVRGEIDELQCLNAHFAPYHGGGSFMGFAEVIPLLAFVNRHGIPLEFDKAGKHVAFQWKRAYLQQHHELAGSGLTDGDKGCGSTIYNPLESVPAGSEVTTEMRQLAEDYRRGKVSDVANHLLEMIQEHPHDQGVSYALAVCLARVGMLSRARDVLGRQQSTTLSHPRCRRLYEDLVQRVGPSVARSITEPKPELADCPMTLFAMPKPFTGHNGKIQRNAIRSWARLEPKPEIILFGDEAGIKEMAQEIGARYIPEVGRNEFGTPLVNKLFGAAQDCASNTILAYVNADMILSQDFAEGVRRVYAELPEFLLIGQRWDLALLEEIDFDDPQWQRRLLGQMQEHGMLHAECGLDYFVFRRGMYRHIPPFAIGRTAWDNWLVMAPNKAGVPVVDGTEFITVIHQEHDYGHVDGGRHEAWKGIEASRNQALMGSSDNSCQTSGASWKLGKDGVLIEVQPQLPEYLSLEYKDRRITWLLEQADRLMTAGHAELAACKWEEAMARLESQFTLTKVNGAASQGVDPQELTRRYVIACTKVAHCYMRMGRRGQALAAYTGLLENPHVCIPETQRRDIAQIRNELTALMAHERPSVTPAASAPTLEACVVSPDRYEHYSEGLSRLERTYQTMPDGSRAKHTLALRLSGLFRRAGLLDKSQAFEAEAAHTDNTSNVPAVPQHSAPLRPKVSIVTTCHNSERFLPECLDSIQSQHFEAWELFLLDDGSTDGTRRVIEAYAHRDPRIKPFYFDRNEGPYIRRNFAIQRARSDFIVIHDADDIMAQDKLDVLYHTISADKRFAMVGSSYLIFLEESQRLEYADSVKLRPDHESIAELVSTWRHGISHGAAIIRKSMFDRIGLYDENPFASDSFWSAKLAEYSRHYPDGRFKNVPQYLTFIRVHDASQTQRLPMSDPRSRRSRYHIYCQVKLNRIREKIQSIPGTDVASELRRCDCSDFLTRFETHIIKWESEAPDPRIVSELLDVAFRLFEQGHYVSCISTLCGVQAMVPNIGNQTMGFDLLRGMAFFAVGMKQRCGQCLDRELQNHGNPAARQFAADASERETPLNVADWCRQNNQKYDLMPAFDRVKRSNIPVLQGSEETEYRAL